MSFPRAAREGEPAPAAEKEGAAAIPDRAEKARILVVEDNPDTQFFMQTLLESVGEVRVASNATEALQEARGALEGGKAADPEERSHGFDVVLMDINLGPGKSGAEVLGELRALPGYREVPVAAVTAYALPGDRERLLAMGFDAYLAKPFDPEELLDLIIRLLK